MIAPKAWEGVSSLTSELTLEGMRIMVQKFQTTLIRIHEEMKDAEAMAEFLGVPVPWAPEPKAETTKGGYVSHKDGREVMLSLLARKRRGARFHAAELLGEANIRMSSEGRSGYSRPAIDSWLRKFTAQGIVKREGGGAFSVIVDLSGY